MDSFANVHSVQTSNTLCAVSDRVSSSIPADLTHIGLFTPWLLRSPLRCYGSSGCFPHAHRHCSIQKLEPSSLAVSVRAPQSSSSLFLERLKTIFFVGDRTYSALHRL